MSEPPITLEPVALPGGWGATYAAPQPSSYAELPEEDRAHWESLAAEFLWRWTGRRFGLTEVLVIPCYRPALGSTFRGSGPRTSGREWFAYGSPGLMLSCGLCGPVCGCGRPFAVKLPGPVAEVLEVTIDGDVLDPAAYTLRRGGRLTRIDGNRWPAIPNLSPRDEEEGKGWQVRYVRGVALPTPGRIAVGILAIEFWKAYAGDRSCQLPTRLSSITREGVSVTVLDTFEDLDAGHTGIWLVDSWVSSVTRAPLPPVVASPDYSARGRFL